MNLKIREHFLKLYGDEAAEKWYPDLVALVEKYKGQIASNRGIDEGLAVDESDVLLITYADSLVDPDEPPLRTLGRFLNDHLEGVVSGVHILPFFPYSSDDGFSVIDYREVREDLGSWSDVEALRQRFRLMFDLVLNHISAKSEWFQGYLRGDDRFKDYFIEVSEGADLSNVVRPRALPLLTEFETHSGTKSLWTTFSADQIDLNFASPRLLLEMIDVFLDYVRRGSGFIRLDAIAYLWKEIGTSCIHLEQTHRVVKLFKAILDEAAPGTIIITEANVPHDENISYFGSGFDEAQMVYQFSLPPLILDAFLRADASHLRSWASGLETAAGSTTFFNFCASHDGVGVTPTHGILSEEELRSLVQGVLDRGGFVSTKATAEGEIPYELNISYVDAIAPPDVPPADRAERFLTSQAIMISMIGVPGIYIHSLLGSGSDRNGVERTGMKRSINREKLDMNTLADELADSQSLRSRIFFGYIDMLKKRREHPAFHPMGTQQILASEGSLFCLLRTSPDGGERLVCVFNTGPEEASFRFPVSELGEGAREFVDVLSGRVESATDVASVTVPGYCRMWLKAVGSV